MASRILIDYCDRKKISGEKVAKMGKVYVKRREEKCHFSQVLACAASEMLSVCVLPLALLEKRSMVFVYPHQVFYHRGGFQHSMVGGAFVF